MAEPQVASLNPDNFVAAGLATDFDGTVVKACFVPWDYNGKIDHHVLAVHLEIAFDEPEDPNTPTTDVFWSAGDLENWVPSKDAKTPVDLQSGKGEELEGEFALRVGKQEGLSSSSNFAHAITAAIMAGLPKERLAASVAKTWLGVHGHWDRVPQKKRSGLVNARPQQGENRSNDILVLSQFKDVRTSGVAGGGPKKSAPAAASSSPKPAQPTTETAASSSGEVSELDAALIGIVVEAVQAAGEAGIAKGQLPRIAMKTLAAAMKGKGVKRIVETEFLGGLAEYGVLFDGDSGMLTFVPE